MTILHQHPSKTVFSDGQEIYHCEAREWLKRNKITADLLSFVTSQTFMLEVARTFPFVDEIVTFEKEGMYRIHLFTAKGIKRIVSFNDVRQWVEMYKGDEINYLLDISKGIDGYKFDSAVLDVTEKYFIEGFRTYLIWNI